jgi:hypothetical protein
MLVPLSEAKRYLLCACGDYLPNDIPNLTEGSEACTEPSTRTFDEHLAYEVLLAMSQSVNRVLVPGPHKIGKQLLDAIGLAFASCERDRPMHLLAYAPGQLVQQLFYTFWKAYSQLDDERGLEAVAPLSQFQVDIPSAIVPATMTLRQHLNGVDVTTFGTRRLPGR